LSYSFDGKKEEGFKRGFKLFNKVVRERQVEEDADQDLAEYYERANSNPLADKSGFERGKNKFSTLQNQWQCLECGKKFASAASAERAANSDSGCPGCGGSDIDDVPEKQNISDNGPLQEITDPEPIENLSSSDGEAGSSHLSNSPETTDGSFNKVNRGSTVESIESVPNNDNAVGYVESKENRGEDKTGRQEFFSSMNEALEYAKKLESQGKRSKVASQGGKVVVSEIVENESEYPHDILPNSLGIKKGSSKYGSQIKGDLK